MWFGYRELVLIVSFPDLCILYTCTMSVPAIRLKAVGDNIILTKVKCILIFDIQLRNR